MNTHATNRRDWLRQTGAAALGTAALGALPGSLDAAATGTLADATGVAGPHPGHIRQSASRWCYAGIPLPQLCKAAGQIGLMGIDLLQRADWDVVNDSGLTCTMGYAADRRDFLTNGFTNRASHAMLIRELEDALPVAKQKNVPNLIAMFGNRAGRTDAEAIAAAIEGL